jgi:hypothetical protein
VFLSITHSAVQTCSLCTPRRRRASSTRYAVRFTATVRCADAPDLWY